MNELKTTSVSISSASITVAGQPTTKNREALSKTRSAMKTKVVLSFVIFQAIEANSKNFVLG